MVVVISVDGYRFLAFSDLSCHLKDTGIVVFCYTVLPDSKETELGSSDQEASPSAGKNIEIALAPCRAWKCVPPAISGGVDIPEVPECNLLRQISSQ